MNLIKFFVIAIGNIFIGAFIYFSEDQIDRLTRGICPAGFWHEGLYWAHCSYSVFSVAKYGTMYFVFSFLSFMLLLMANPANVAILKRCFSIVYLAAPVVYMLFAGLSWSASLGFILVLIFLSILNVYHKARLAW